MYLKPRYLGLGSISNLHTYNILLWNDVVKCLQVVDQSRKGKLMDALRKNIEENLRTSEKKVVLQQQKNKSILIAGSTKKNAFQ